MITKQQNDISWLEFELLADCPITHACLKRHGGCSEGPLESLNLGNTVGDSPENVKHNMAKVLNTLNLPQCISPRLCHGDQIISISTTQDIIRPVCDGLATQSLHCGLMISHADCQAAIFYDPIHHALANVHCGWRGNVQNIYYSTVLHMQQVYNSNPKNLLVCISPSLGPENSEFINYKQELPESFWDYQIKPNYFDLWSISEMQLKEAGILPSHIQIARIDTYACENDYFSYRRSKPTGRQATFCALRS